MKVAFGCAAIAALLSTSVLAQAAPVAESAPIETAAAVPAMPAPAPVAEVAPQPQDVVLPAGTEILLAMATEINSTANREGETFPLTVVSDVRIGDEVVIPRGTRAIGEITWRTGRGAFGKSGKMDIALRYIDLEGQRLPIEGTYRQEGDGATVATLAGIVAVGIFAGFITGKRATVPVGRELMSRTAQPIPFTMPGGRLSSAYDARLALAAAEGESIEAQCRAQAEAQGRGNDARIERLERACIRTRNAR